MHFSRTTVAAIAAIGALTLAGCSAPSTSPEQPEQGQQQSPQEGNGQTSSGTGPAEESPQETDAAPTETETDSQGNAAPDAKVVASKKISVDQSKLKVDLYEIKDDGALATVNIGLTVEDGKSFQVLGLFSDGSTTEPGKDGKPSNAWRYSMSGVTITDTKNKKVHRVAYDSGMDCLCSSSLHHTALEPGDKIYLNASYASIPDDQQSATVTVPNVGTFTEVPILR